MLKELLLMIRSKKLYIALAVLGALVVILIFAGIFSFGTKTDSERTRIGFVLTGDIDEEGWNSMNYNGIKYACDKLDCDLLVKDNIAEFSGECPDAVRELIDDGAEVIFLSSYGYADEVFDIITENPQISFYANTTSEKADNLSTYFIRLYQARYLSGIIAGMTTKTGKLGYVAAMPNSEVNRGINAFALGVKRVNPDAEVIVKWIDSWDDKDAETEAVHQLKEKENIDIVTYHQNRMNVIDAAEEEGIASIGYHEAPEGYSPKLLTSVICDWDTTYESLIRDCVQGKRNASQIYWLGINEGVVHLSEYSSEVSEEARLAVDEAESEMLNGRAVFSGKLYDNAGNLLCGEGETISDQQLFENTDWLLEGVRVCHE
jgi:basic membrane protein A